MGTGQIQNGEGMISEQVQNRHRTEVERKWIGYGTDEENRLGQNLSSSVPGKESLILLSIPC